MKYIFFILFTLNLSLFAQDNLLDSLENDVPKTKTFTSATFKGTRLINLHTVETLGKKSLEFRISHRFGEMSDGAYTLYGLDGPASIRLGFDYALTNRLVLGIGRSNINKLFDGFVKFRILRQTVENEMPISVTGLVAMNVLGTKKDPNGVEFGAFSERISYFYKLMIARKFNQKLSLQVSPMLVHYNVVPKIEDQNDLIAAAGSGRYKITRSIAFTAEYALRIGYYATDQRNYFNTASCGIDIETGGHVFQVFVSNALAINEVQWLPYNNSDPSKGQMRLGFNVSRVFGLGGKNKKSQKSW